MSLIPAVRELERFAVGRARVLDLPSHPYRLDGGVSQACLDPLEHEILDVVSGNDSNLSHLKGCLRLKVNQERP